MKLNLKYLESQLNNGQQALAESQAEPEGLIKDENGERRAAAKKKTYQLMIWFRKKINKCGHEDKSHYAKGMCNNCYHKFGRNKKPWNCPHNKLYAAGMCQNCYINNYNRKKREEKLQEGDKNEA